MLMVLLDLFPAGILQFNAVATKGLWFARAAEFIEQDSFQMLTWLRIIGGSVFFIGGVLPLIKIIFNTQQHLKPAKTVSKEMAEEVENAAVY